MNLDFNNILPYAVALLVAIPIITMFRTFTNDFLELKKEGNPHSEWSKKRDSFPSI